MLVFCSLPGFIISSFQNIFLVKAVIRHNTYQHEKLFLQLILREKNNLLTPQTKKCLVHIVLLFIKLIVYVCQR